MKRTMMLAMVLMTMFGLCGKVFGSDPVQLKSPCNLFMLNPHTGAVLGIDAKAKTATLYPKDYIDGKNKTVVGPVEIAAGAQGVLFKKYKDKGYFIICFADSTQIFILDAGTLKVAGKVTVKQVVNNTFTTSSDPDDPYVYCAGGFYEGGDYFSMKTRAWAGNTGVRGSDIAVSADGNYIYSRSTGVSPTGFDCYKKTVNSATGKMAWMKIYDEHTSVVTYVPGPFSRYCATGTDMYSVNLKKKVVKFDFVPKCFFRKSPVIVGLSGGQLVAASYNTFKTFSIGELPDSFLAGDDSDKKRKYRRRRGRNFDVKCMADDANKRVVLGFGRRVMVKTFKDMNVPDEPFLVCKVKAPDTLFVGHKATLAITPIDKRCKIRLQKGPAGMSLKGGKLIWTPTAAQVGAVKVVLQLSAGTIKATHTFKMNVTPHYATLPFVPPSAGLNVSPNGSRAVVWTGSQSERWSDERKPQPSKIALVDLKKMKVIVQKTLPYTIRTAAVDANFVYVAPTSADRINALDLKDLSRKNYTITDSSVTELLTIASRRLVANTANHGPRVYDVPKLKAADSPVVSKSGEEVYSGRGFRGRYMRPTRSPYYRRSAGSGDMPVKVGRNWYAAGCLFGPDLARAKMLVDAAGMVTLSDRHEAEAVIPLPWNRIVANSNLVSRTGQRIAEFGKSPTAILSHVPVAATLIVGINQGKGSGYRDRNITITMSAVLNLRELVSGKVVRKVSLMSGVPIQANRSSYDRYGHRATLVDSGSRVVAVVGNRLFVHSLSKEILKQFPRPFDFEPLSEVPILSLTRPTVVKSKTVGGTEPIEFELLGSQKELKIDTKTGAVTIDGTALVKRAVTELISQMEEYVSRDGESARQTPKQIVAIATRKSATKFKNYTGKPPKGIPVLVPVRVAATDKHQHVASLQYQAVIDLPKKLLLKKIEAMIAKVEKERQEKEKLVSERERQWRQERDRRRAVSEASRRAATRPADPETTRKLEERIKELEQQVRELKTKVELLITLVKEKR